MGTNCGFLLPNIILLNFFKKKFNKNLEIPNSHLLLFNNLPLKVKQMENSFTDQIAAHAVALKGYALFLTQNKDDAHDLLQETYLKAFSNRDRFAPDTNLKGWLYTIMKNTFINNYRRKVKRNTFVDHTEQDYYINQANQHIPNQAESKMVMEDLNAAIAVLPLELKEAFMLNFRGHKYQDIADRFGIPIGTVKTRIHLARKALKRKLSIYGDLYGMNTA